MATTAQKLSQIMAHLATQAACACAFPSWDDAYARNKCKEAWTDTYALSEPFGWRFTIEELAVLSHEELWMAGFRMWDEEMYVIPLYLVNFIKRGEVVTNIFGDTHLIDECDLDIRFGCIAYGFKRVEKQ